MNKPTNKLIALIILLVLSTTTIVSAELPVEVSIIVPDNAYVGDSFNITIHVNPNNTQIAGMQLNFVYDPKSIVINNITEGNLFTNADTFDTFFVDGTYKYGAVEDIYTTILGQGSTTIPNNFITINAIATSPGEKSFKITNVVIASPEGTLIENISHNTVFIASEYPPYDLNKDGVVNILDLTIVAQHFGLVV